MSDSLRAALVTLADARADKAAADDALAMKRAEFARENAALVAHTTSLATEVATAEGAVRALAREVYDRTKDKAPIAGVSIKLFSTMEYEEERALAWARATKMALIPESLDAKAFAKIAAVTPLEFVTYRQEPRVVIATQLTEALLTAPAMTDERAHEILTERTRT